MKNKLLGIITFMMLPLAAHATEYQVVQRPRQECWNEQVPVGSSNAGGAVLGGLAGGVIGNQVGNRHNRGITTVLGAFTGAMIGDRISSRSTQYETVQRCQTVMEETRVPVYRRPERIVYEAAPIQYVEPVYYERIEPRHHHRHWDHDNDRNGYYDHDGYR